jgi:hypothetical protein
MADAVGTPPTDLTTSYSKCRRNSEGPECCVVLTSLYCFLNNSARKERVTLKLLTFVRMSGWDSTKSRGEFQARGKWINNDEFRSDLRLVTGESRGPGRRQSVRLHRDPLKLGSALPAFGGRRCARLKRYEDNSRSLPGGRQTSRNQQQPKTSDGANRRRCQLVCTRRYCLLNFGFLFKFDQNSAGH